jgi:hypothetical protein
MLEILIQQLNLFFQQSISLFQSSNIFKQGFAMHLNILDISQRFLRKNGASSLFQLLLLLRGKVLLFLNSGQE